MMLPCGFGYHEFGADAVGAGDENRIYETCGFEVEKRPESAKGDIGPTA